MESEFTTIASFEYLADAQIVKAKLESEGIPTFLKDENILTVGFIRDAIGGVKLQVKTKDKAAARAVLVTKLPSERRRLLIQSRAAAVARRLTGMRYRGSIHRAVRKYPPT